MLSVWPPLLCRPLAGSGKRNCLSLPETYGSTSRIRRASASIGANLAEGCARNGDTELARFCSIARGSASELEYHLLLAKDLQFLPATLREKLAADAVEIKRMLNRSHSKAGG
jgi:four helix bundle protein